MKRVISASRRTDLLAFFPEELAQMLDHKIAKVYGPSGFTYSVDLTPDNVHTIVLWSKNFDNFIHNRFSVRERLKNYASLYCHFTITGLGGGFIERGVPRPGAALRQVEALLTLLDRPERISIRFDPIVFWRDPSGDERTNLHFFKKLSPFLAAAGIRTVRFSFAQWYTKAKRRAQSRNFVFVDPSNEEKLRMASDLSAIARDSGVNLYACSQNFLSDVTGIYRSSCIDAALLQDLHPQKESPSVKKDKTQRSECGCTESIDIGSYAQSCPHSCLYCYANPRV